jgi:hypothetical protein
MVGGILVIIFSGIFSFVFIDRIKGRYPSIDAPFLKKLFFYHLLLFFAYYTYVMFSPSDSKWYYQKVVLDFRGETWGSFYGTSTTFIEFIGYPFIKYLGFSYEAMMALFSLFGFLGMIYLYLFYKENIRFKHKLFGFNLLPLFFLLPNLHFWSSSFGKGSVILLGIGLYFFGLSNLRARYAAMIIGSIIIYHVRPHIMLVMLISTVIAFVFSAKNMGGGMRVIFLIAAVAAFFFIYRDVMKLVGIDEDEPVKQSFTLTHRATELSKATSGVDITTYSLPMQLFTFLYRPLFIDAPGALGIFVSFENVFYLLITVIFLGRLSGWKFLLTSSFLVKSAFLSFFTVALALAQISGNLGLAIRQKSQVMLLFLFVVISFLDQQKIEQWKELALQKKASERRKKALLDAKQSQNQ